MQKSKNIYSKVNFKSIKYYKVSNNFLSENNQRNVNDVLSVTVQPSWERGQHCMRPRTRPRLDATRPRLKPKILALRPGWPRGLNIPGYWFAAENALDKLSCWYSCGIKLLFLVKIVSHSSFVLIRLACWLKSSALLEQLHVADGGPYFSASLTYFLRRWVVAWSGSYEFE